MNLIRKMDTLFTVWCITAWILMGYMHEVAAKRPECLFTEDITSIEHTCIEIKCKGNGYVIADLQIAAGMTKTNSNRIDSLDKCIHCLGETAAFIDQSLDCFWKPSCKIYFTTDQMITSRGGGLQDFIKRKDTYQVWNSGCYNELINFACVLSAKCIRESDIIDIKVYEQGLPKVITNNRGIIRSHGSYPFVYDSKTFNKTHELTKTIHRKLEVGFYDLDLPEGDNITITTNKKTVKANSSSVQVVYTDKSGIEDKKLTDVLHFDDEDGHIKFSLELDGLAQFRGFVVCFKEKKDKKKKNRNTRVKNRQRRRTKGDKKHTCDKIMTDAKIVTISPYIQKCQQHFRSNRKAHRSTKNSRNYGLKSLRKAKKNCCCNRIDKQKCKDALGSAHGYSGFNSNETKCGYS